jgi:3-oxoadipate enol-lactonase
LALIVSSVATSRGDIGCVASAPGASDPALVLLHPLASAGGLWQPLMAWLGERGIRAVAPTLPGPMGDNARGGRPTIASMAEDVSALIDALALEHVDVLGMSMGGCVAQALTLARPNAVRSLVLVDTTSDYGADRAAKWEVRAVAASGSSRRELLPFQLDRWFSPRFRVEHPREVDRIAAIFVDCRPAVHAACCRALGEFDCTSRLPEIAVPTLILVGADDYATPVAMAHTLHAGIADSTLHILPGVRHMSVLENRNTWGLVREFVAERRPVATRG